MSRKPLANVDTAWLRMEDPTNLMMITGMMTFDTPIDFEKYKECIQERLLRFERFRQRVIHSGPPIDLAYWEDDPHFDIDFHVQRAFLRPPGDLEALQDLVSEMMSTQLDFSRPPWQFHLVEHYGEGSAVIARLHHCIADGISLMYVLLGLADPDPTSDTPTFTVEPVCAEQVAPDGYLSALIKPARKMLRQTSRMTDAIWHEGLDSLIYPPHLVELTRKGASGVAAFGRLVLRWPDPHTLFKGPLGKSKRAVWSAAISLEDVKTIGRAMEGTVNDILLTAVSGALRSYLLDCDQDIEGMDIRAAVPVNLRPINLAKELGNQFGLIFPALPIGMADPAARLRELKRRMDEIKHTPEAVVAFGILNTIGMVPSEIQDIVVDIFGTKATAVMTNVAGPRKPIYMAGSRMNTLMSWVPQSGRLGMGVSIMSYAGRVWLGIATDEGLVPDPEKIIQAFQAEFCQLLTTAQKNLQRHSTTARPMLNLLDDALLTVDEIIETRRAEAELQAQVDAGTLEHCVATTKAGGLCKNKPLAGSAFCRRHQKEPAL